MSKIETARRNQIAAIVAARFLVQIGNGATVREAFDTVLGAGTFDKLAGEVYETLRARAGL